MCGFTGLWTVQPITESEMEDQLRRMTDAIRHRGPDDRQNWADPGAGLGLGFARLAILDLSEEGRQPMHSASGRFVITFNGEIYNFRELREELAGLGHSFRGTSDTEVILASVEQWGARAAVQRFNGMFAIALWDRREQALRLIRDRVGIKPLYYGWSGGALLFGSELKALRQSRFFQAGIDRDALAVFMRHNYIPAPYSIYQGICKLPPGTMLTLRSPSEGAQAQLEPQAYWSAADAVREGLAHPFQGSLNEAVDELEALLKDAVGRRMIADVPLGAFLSGGIDSPTVVALMQAQSSRPVRTFSIGFTEDDYNEAGYASRIARQLGTDHTELCVTPEEARAVIPLLGRMYDEPFADASQIPTYLVSKLAREHVIVSLSGDGGDELFGGYNRYFWGRSIWRRMRHLPAGLRGGLRRGMTALPPGGWQGLHDLLRPVLPGGMRQPYFGDKLHKLAGILDASGPADLYRRLVSHWDNPAALVPGSGEHRTALDSPAGIGFSHFSEQMMYLDLVSYLPDDILAKVDRASMAVSLEARVPLLDHRVVEFAWRLPLEMKIQGHTGKLPLRALRDRYLQDDVDGRAKMGFAVPIDSWLRGPLRGWAEDLLAPDLIRGQGYLESEMVREKWEEHVSGRRNWQYLLWDVLMFQAWLQE